MVVTSADGASGDMTHPMRNSSKSRKRDPKDIGRGAMDDVESIAHGDRSFRSPKKTIPFGLQAVVGNLVFSTTEVWAYYEIPTTIYDFLSNAGKVSYANSLDAAIKGIVKNQDKPLDLDLNITNTPIDIEMWEKDFVKLARENFGLQRSGFKRFLSEQVDWLTSGNFIEKRVFIGVCLGRRRELDTDLANPFNKGFRDAMTYLKGYMDKMMLLHDLRVSDEEIVHAQTQEIPYYQSISVSSLHGERASTEDLALLVKKQFYPAMPVPYVSYENQRWGRGDMARDLGGLIRLEDPKMVEVHQIIDGREMTGYEATLTFKQFPTDALGVPHAPWIYDSVFSAVAAPFDVHARVTLVPARKIKGEIEKGIAQSMDAYYNATQAGSDPGIALTDEVEKGREMQAQVSKNKDPWLSGTYRLSLTASTKEDLDDYCETMIRYYDESLNVKLAWTYHDQLDLLLEGMPGDHLRENSFIQTTDVHMISASGFNVMNQVGD